MREDSPGILTFCGGRSSLTVERDIASLVYPSCPLRSGWSVHGASAEEEGW